jgi:hypothetical protein
MQHERAAPRRRILKAGQILFGPSAIDCVVRNISATGACIVVNSPLWYPDSFILAVTSDSASRRCHIVWRRDGQVGLAFDD